MSIGNSNPVIGRKLLKVKNEVCRIEPEINLDCHEFWFAVRPRANTTFDAFHHTEGFPNLARNAIPDPQFG